MNKGNLFYVVGPSGVGKDTILHYCREHQEGLQLVFLHRYITRPADAGSENHIALSTEEFIKRRNNDLFPLHWESHGLMYGIGAELDLYLEKGFHVVMNGSRGYLPDALKRYPSLKLVLITAKTETLKKRLEERGRESQEEITKRLERATEFQIDIPGMITISNDGTIEEAGKQLLKCFD